jgi:septum formation protein
MLVLASSSPRRQDLLKRLTQHFEIATSAVEEEGSALAFPWLIPPLDLPVDYAIDVTSHPTLWAWRKAVDVAARRADPEHRLVLAADTIVIGQRRILGKPGTEIVAAEMLAELRGKKHYVATGGVLLKAGLPDDLPLQFAVVSAVWMRNYSDDELQGYVATGEPMDKAGAYAVQGFGGRLVERVEGCYLNVVGLPLCEVREALSTAGVELAPYPAGGYCDFCPLRASR